MRFYWLVLVAWIRGAFYRWPRQPWPDHGVSCGLKTLADCRAMYRHGWDPYAFQRTPGLGTSRVFRVKEDDSAGSYA